MISPGGQEQGPGAYLTGQYASLGHSWQGFEPGDVMEFRASRGENLPVPALVVPDDGEWGFSTWTGGSEVDGQFRHAGTQLAEVWSTASGPVQVAGDWSLPGFLFAFSSVVPGYAYMPIGP